MSVTGRWRIRWRRKAKDWLDQHVHRLTAFQRRTLRFALDRRLQQIAQFPYSGQSCSAHFPNLDDLPETYRVVFIHDLVLIYEVDEDEQIIILVHFQTTAMDAPRPEMLLQ